MKVTTKHGNVLSPDTELRLTLKQIYAFFSALFGFLAIVFWFLMGQIQANGDSIKQANGGVNVIIDKLKKEDIEPLKAGYHAHDKYIYNLTERVNSREQANHNSHVPARPRVNTAPPSEWDGVPTF